MMNERKKSKNEIKVWKLVSGGFDGSLRITDFVLLDILELLDKNDWVQ